MDAHQGLLRTIDRAVAELGGGGRALHRIEPREPVVDHHPVRHPGGRGFKTDLPVDRIGAEEGEVHARVARVLGGVEHLVAPVLVVAGREEGLVVEQRPATGMGIDVGRIGDVVARHLEPADELDLPVEELAATARRKRPVKGDLDRPGGAGDRVRAKAVVVVQALAGQSVVGVVVVRLVGIDPMLKQKGGRPGVADHEDYVVLVPAGIGEHHHVDAAGPVAGNGEAVGGGPVTGDQPGGGVDRTGRLRHPTQRDVQPEPSAEPPIPSDSIEIHGVALRRIGGDEEVQGAALEHAVGRGIALDLLHRVVGDPRPQLPPGGAGLLVFRHDGI